MARRATLRPDRPDRSVRVCVTSHCDLDPPPVGEDAGGRASVVEITVANRDQPAARLV